MTEIKFTIPGRVQPQERPRATNVGKFISVYDAPKSRAYKKIVKFYASRFAPESLLEGQLEVTVLVFKEYPKSFSLTKAAEAESGRLRPTTKPDADNYAKGILDSLKGTIWIDDGQVVDLIARKYYSKTPRAEVTIRTLEEVTVQEKLFYEEC